MYSFPMNNYFSNDEDIQYCMKGGKKISEGGYGCVYYPEIQCSGETKSVENSKYISKIQKESSASRTEEYIGSVIKTIPNYTFYYAPIVSSCPIELSKLKQGDVKECDIFKKYGIHKKYILQKVPYIKGQSFLEFFFSKKNLNTSGNPNHNKNKEALLFLFDSFPYLIQSLKQMNEIGVIHYDLKKENVLFDIHRNIPIVIDFGLSLFLPKDCLKQKVYDEKFGFVDTLIQQSVYLDTMEEKIKNSSNHSYSIETNEIQQLMKNFEMVYTELEKMKHFDFEKYNIQIEDLDFKKLKDKFFIYAPDYYLWCPEIQLINYVLHENNNPNKDDLVYLANEIIDSSVLSTRFSNYIVNSLKQKLVDFFMGFVDKNYTTIIFECLQYYRKWDSYSLCMMYLVIIVNILKQTNIEFRNYLKQTNKSIILDFIVVLLDGLHPNPKIRSSFEELSIEFKNIMVRFVEQQPTEYNSFIEIIGKNDVEIKKNIIEETKQLEKTSKTFIEKKHKLH